MNLLFLSLCILSPALAQLPGNCSNIPDIPTALPQGYKDNELGTFYVIAMFSTKPDNWTTDQKCFTFTMEKNDTLPETQSYTAATSLVAKNGTKTDKTYFFKFYPDNSKTFVGSDKDGKYVEEPYVAGRTIMKKDLNSGDPSKAKAYYVDLMWTRNKDDSNKDCVLSWMVWSNSKQLTDGEFKGAIERIKQFDLPVDGDKIWKTAPDC